jgi:hypothetical protein
MLSPRDIYRNKNGRKNGNIPNINNKIIINI